MRLDALQAAFLSTKIKFLDHITNKRINNAKIYCESLNNQIEVPNEDNDIKSVYQTFVVQTDRRDSLKLWLEKNMIETKIHYPIPIHLQSAAKYLKYKRGDFPRAEKMANTTLSLPVHEFIKENDIKYVANLINKFY